MYVYLFLQQNNDIVCHLFSQGWGMYAQLLIDQFRFLSPFLRNAELNKQSTEVLYTVTQPTLSCLQLIYEL